MFRKSAGLTEETVGSVFLTNNNTQVVAHRGSTTTLYCQVVKDSQYGVVSSIIFEQKMNFDTNKKGYKTTVIVIDFLKF